MGLPALACALALLACRTAGAQAAEYSYAALQSGGVAQFALGAGGVLVPLSPADAAGGQDLSIVITPNGRYLYAGDNTSGAIDQFAIEAGGTRRRIRSP